MRTRNPRCLFICLAGSALLAVSALAGFTGTDVFLPSVGRAQGIATWYTAVWVHNPDAAPAIATFYFLQRDQVNTGALPVSVTIPGGDTAHYANALADLFGREGFGAIRVVCPSKLLVTSRIFSKATSESERDSKGQDFAGIPASFAIGAGQKTEILGATQTQPTASAEFRTNFGFVETTGASCSVKVTATDPTGPGVSLSKTYTVRALEQKQYMMTQEFPTLGSDNARLEVEVVTGPGKVIAFGSVITNGSQDPTTFEMQFRDELLAESGAGGLTSVTHDATLTGDGTSGNPLGLANAAVSKGKLSASGGTSGQVLGTDGTNLVWQSASGGSLPSGTSGQTLYNNGSAWTASSALTNDGTNVGVSGILNLPNTTASAGQISFGGNPFLNNYGGTNTFVGQHSGNFTMTGAYNSALGFYSLTVNTAGAGNTASGYATLVANTTGSDNTAIGESSLRSNTTASKNTAVGAGALYAQSFSNGNTAWDSWNTAVGYGALYSNQPNDQSHGHQNTALGSKALYSNTTGYSNTASGFASLAANTTGAGNTASGAGSLQSNTTGYHNTASGVESLGSNTTGYFNTASGARSLQFNTTGSNNTASGIQSLQSNTTGSNNTASGIQSLEHNTTGHENVAVGANSLRSNTTAGRNTAVGYEALFSQSYGPGGDWASSNTAMGYRALYSNQPTSLQDGIRNTAVGAWGLQSNTSGTHNTASGSESLNSNTTGNDNTASGSGSLYFNTTGSENTAIGRDSLYSNISGRHNTALGCRAGYSTTGLYNIAIGWGAGSSITGGSYNIDIGSGGEAGDVGTIRIGDPSTTASTFIYGIYGVDNGWATTYVSVTPQGRLGTPTSSIRFKQDVDDMGEASSPLMELRPVTFHYKAHPDGPLQYGLIAEEVEQVMPELVVKDAAGQPMTVAYPELPAMLLNELQKQHATIQEQQTQIESRDAKVADLEARLAALEALLAGR